MSFSANCFRIENSLHATWRITRGNDSAQIWCREWYRKLPFLFHYFHAFCQSLIVPLPRILFGNYDVKLKAPLALENNGHSGRSGEKNNQRQVQQYPLQSTAHMDIPETINGKRPFITGGLLNGRFLAEGFHFHWGSINQRGSEHSINKQRFDVEMHIVHRNARYSDLTEAVKHKDGVAVLGVMFKVVKVGWRHITGFFSKRICWIKS